MDEPTFILRRLTVLQTWRQTWDVFMKRYDLFLILASLSYIMTIILYGSTLNYLTDMNDPALHEKSGVLLVESCLHSLINIVGHAAMSRGVAEIYVGRAPILHECLMQGFQVLCPLVGVWIVTLAAAMVAYFGLLGVAEQLGEIFGFSWLFLGLLFIASGIGVALIIGLMSLINPIATIEKIGTFGIMKRSFGLASQDLGFVLFTIIALDCARLVVDRLIKFLFIDFDEMSYADIHYSWTGVVIPKLTILLFAPLTSIMQTLIYFNICIEKEGLNGQILGQLLELEGVFGSPAPVMNPVSSPGYTPVNLGSSELSMSGMVGGAGNSSPLVSEAL